jgi:hypothetical protein
MRTLVAILIGLVLVVLLLQGRQLLMEHQAALDREQTQVAEWEAERRLHDQQRHAPPEWVGGMSRMPAWIYQGPNGDVRDPRNTPR